MFKNIKENEYVKKIIELWHIPRYRSLLVLGIYIVFFMIVIALIDISKPVNLNDKPKVNVLDVYSSMESYKYKAIIENEKTETLTGKVYVSDQIINFNEENYYYNNIYLYKQDGEVYKKVSEKVLDFEIWRMTPPIIRALVKKGKFDSKTEYSDGIIANTYLVSVSDFVKLYYVEDTENYESIKITLYENKNNILKVYLDLTNVYKHSQDANNYDYEVTIEYELIDVMNPIDVEIESSD